VALRLSLLRYEPRGIWMDLKIFEHSHLVDCLVGSRLPQFFLSNSEHKMTSTRTSSRGPLFFWKDAIFFLSNVLYCICRETTVRDLGQVLLERAYGAFPSTILHYLLIPQITTRTAPSFGSNALVKVNWMMQLASLAYARAMHRLLNRLNRVMFCSGKGVMHLAQRQSSGHRENAR